MSSEAMMGASPAKTVLTWLVSSAYRRAGGDKASQTHFVRIGVGEEGVAGRAVDEARILWERVWTDQA